MRIIITSPSLNTSHNVSGISEVTRFITTHNRTCTYIHFALGKRDGEARSLAWLGRTVLAYGKWIQTVVREKRAIVHFNLALEHRSLVRDSPLILLARWFRKRVVVHIHGGELLAGRAMPSWLTPIVRSVLADGPVIVLSETEQTMLNKRFPKARTVILRNCVDLAEAKNYGRSKSFDGPMKILFLGRISIPKGIDDLYEALSILVRRGASVRFVLAGTGPAEDVYVPRFRQLLGEDFDFRGVVTGEAKIALLKECHLFVLPSLFEGLPMALLESMAFGVVPVTTGVGSIPTVVTHAQNGMVVKVKSPEDIADAVESLVADRDLLQTLSNNSRDFMIRECDPEAYVSQLRGIYAL
jgi:glycosyltransferase involved in cell wall biosynthesis